MNSPAICVIGDTHGHLQLALCVAARWQKELGLRFEAVLLAGDVGCFTEEGQLDGATRAHAESNPCELEFLYQWAAEPQSPWLAGIFAPLADGGLGLECPVVMVHGNHEGFDHLSTLCSRRLPAEPVEIDSLVSVDSGGWIRYLPSGWRCRTSSGVIIGGVGGIERGQRSTRYHDLAYLDDRAVMALLSGGPLDILVTHQGPAAVQGSHGSATLDPLLERGLARYWFHGHSTPIREVTAFGNTTVVPLCDVAFSTRGHKHDEPGDDGWSYLTLGSKPSLIRERPAFWRDYRRSRWIELPGGQLVCPDLAGWVEGGSAPRPTARRDQ